MQSNCVFGTLTDWVRQIFLSLVRRVCELSATGAEAVMMR